MTRAILFDFNGVIANDEPAHCRALIETLAESDIALSPNDYARHYLGLDDFACFRKAWQLAGRGEVPLENLDELVDRKHRRYADAVALGVSAVPGVIEFIGLARDQGTSLAVVSGALRKEIVPVLEVLKIASAFQVLIAGEDVPRCKPDPAGYLLALANLASQPEEAMILEDSLPGLAASRAARIRCTMLTTSHSAAMLSAADAVWENFLGRTPADLPWTSHRA